MTGLSIIISAFILMWPLASIAEELERIADAMMMMDHGSSTKSEE